MRRLLSLLFLLGVPTVTGFSAPAPKPREPAQELRLRAVNAKVQDGQRVIWEVVIVNRSKKAITLVQPGDGSECGWRTPIIEWVLDGRVPVARREVVDVKMGEKKPVPSLRIV